MNLLAVSDVVTGYGPTIVNRGVSLTLAEGEIVTILGPNGAGKSTLLKAIAGLIKPRSGNIAFDGADVTGSAADVMARRGVVLVPEGRKIFVEMTVEENLRLGAYARRDEAAVEADFQTMLAFFPILATKRRDRGGSLSGGQQQMLAIARGLMTRPRVLLLDEPSLGLSPLLVKEIKAIILDIGGRFGASVLLVEQNAGLALAVAARGYLMQNGRIVVSGPIAELRDMSLMRELYLGGVAGAPA
ncbi:ABC transporter ATP-binding protein [Mesorhizobium ciceri]|uniref:ABC transporter ATP-binding protein n=5 Tax=Phyllobacteriaceae TaxID=69277 RepID=UPI0009EEC11F|nr:MULTISPECIES: ABC transporter ATP-binding protein [Mesorhizobium]MDF3233363.1 ABC transporter ATP-binding protein [Mesorhizobium sp. DSM 30133]RUU33516.1 ABC transporter ATP-binding protein [Mesorhizobium sp. Primo-A]RUY23002.1 ABC transporter ATP-binding protein [Mesorhizobium sp. M7A.F.Ca.US.001.04.2.1]RVB82319.1 ABC transporter ATP-binding protein [Mesorhizobium sp. M7A.F.Ca.AU.002.04.1.1]RVB97254.1 ABC transporter ATP-binding protein [Mesorhizobium sp. M7A.F.Ca.AU.002.06.1.1]